MYTTRSRAYNCQFCLEQSTVDCMGTPTNSFATNELHKNIVNLELVMRTHHSSTKASHYLDIKSLIVLIFQKIALIIQRFETPKNLRQMLCIPNDLPPEVEANIRCINQWDFAE